MTVKPFIGLYRSIEEALLFENSPINTQYIFTGVHLLPSNETKYLQTTNTAQGIIVEDWKAYIVEVCSGLKVDITPYVMIENLSHNDKGEPQLTYSITNVPIDFGWKLIYLQLDQLIGESFYSNPFLMTNTDKDNTMHFHYKEQDDAIYQSISMQSYFLEPEKKTELTTYYESSTGNTVSHAIKTNYIKKYRTQLMPKSLLIQFTYLLESPVLYAQGIRNYLFEAIDTGEKVAQENYASFDFKLSPNENDLFFSKGDYNGIDYGKPDYNIYAMTFQEISDLIDSKLASGIKIPAIDHRSVEHALLDYIQANVAIAGDIKPIFADAAYLAANFTADGLGINLRTGWTICNGSNNTIDLAGRTLIHYSADFPNGWSGGEKEHVLTIQELPSHEHSFNKSSQKVGTGNQNGLGNAGTGILTTTDSTGGGLAHNNMQPSYSLVYIMKL